MAGERRRPEMVAVRVAELAMDPINEMPLLILQDERGQERVPIWIGLIEASAIAAELEKIQLQRPMTHDLMKALLGACGARVARVEIHDVRDQTFYASILVQRPGEAAPVPVDARPSDAVALALRAGAPIHVARKVIERSRALDPAARLADAAGGEPIPAEATRFRELLESLADEDFGKWKM